MNFTREIIVASWIRCANGTHGAAGLQGAQALL
jgi:hypothetical protein